MSQGDRERMSSRDMVAGGKIKLNARDETKGGKILRSENNFARGDRHRPCLSSLVAAPHSSAPCAAAVLQRTSNNNERDTILTQAINYALFHYYIFTRLSVPEGGVCQLCNTQSRNVYYRALLRWQTTVTCRDVTKRDRVIM